MESAWQAQICSWIWHACQHDSAAGVRAAAAKCTGQVAEGMPVQGCLSGDLHSGAVSVITLSWVLLHCCLHAW